MKEGVIYLINIQVDILPDSLRRNGVNGVENISVPERFMFNDPSIHVVGVVGVKKIE